MTEPIDDSASPLAFQQVAQPRQEFDLRYPFRTQPDGGPCWCVSSDAPHDGWVHAPLCGEMFRRWWAQDGQLLEQLADHLDGFHGECHCRRKLAELLPTEGSR